MEISLDLKFLNGLKIDFILFILFLLFLEDVEEQH